MCRRPAFAMLTGNQYGGNAMALPEPTPSVDSLDIRKAQPRDLPQVSRTLAYAFYDDPVMTWVTPNDLSRRQALPSMFELVAEALARHDETYTTDNGAGVALWVPPGQPPVAEHDEEAFGRRLEEIAGDDMERLEAVMAVMEEQHPHEPHAYLWFLGVHPTWQGHGIGSALLADAFDRLDREATAAYLEATSPENVRLYQRHDFEIIGILSAHGGAPLWQMWREPGTR
jgi:ribosomal protein S18 acetylase RimI-like enzyme